MTTASAPHRRSAGPGAPETTLTCASTTARSPGAIRASRSAIATVARAESGETIERPAGGGIRWILPWGEDGKGPGVYQSCTYVSHAFLPGSGARVARAVPLLGAQPYA